MEFDSNYKMYEAIAEIFNINLDVLEMIDPYVGEDTGGSNDKWHYGFYVEIPAFDKLDKDLQEELKEWDNIESFPFGDTLYFSDGDLSGTKADPLGWRSGSEDEEKF